MKEQMRLRMKNRILAIMILTMLSLPVQVQAVDDVEPVDAMQEEVVTPITPYKQPVSKRKIAKKFLLAMGGVAASSCIIFLLLTLYNKVRESFVDGAKTPEGEVSLETPDDLQGAVRAFLDKTDWK